MGPFAEERYVPILLTKAGERGALAATATTIKSKLTPLLVVSPIDWDFDSDAPKKNLDEHLANLPQQLVDCWGTNPAFVDLLMLDDGPMASGEQPVEWLTRETGALGLELVPTADPDRTATYIAAVARVVARDSNGVCVRLTVSSWPSVAGPGPLNGLLASLNVTPSDCHLILDLAEDTGLAAQGLAISELRALPHVGAWQSVTIAGTGMPQTAPAGSGLHVIERSEWGIYRTIRALTTPVPRLPSFGDYAIASVNPVSDVDPKYMNISAQLRYTSGDDWLVAKGGLFKGNAGRSQGGAAVPPAAQLIVSHPGFFGAAHCGFDNWLTSVSAGTQNGGNAQVWRRFGTLHHLQTVTEQIANLP